MAGSITLCIEPGDAQLNICLFCTNTVGNTYFTLDSATAHDFIYICVHFHMFSGRITVSSGTPNINGFSSLHISQQQTSSQIATIWTHTPNTPNLSAKLLQCRYRRHTIKHTQGHNAVCVHPSSWLDILSHGITKTNTSTKFNAGFPSKYNSYQLQLYNLVLCMCDVAGTNAGNQQNQLNCA